MKSWIAIVAAVVSGVTEALGLAALLPILTESGQSTSAVTWILASLGALLITSTLAKLCSERTTASVATDVELNARRQYVAALARSKWAAVSKLDQGSITSAVMSEATQISNGVNALLTGMSTLIVVAVLAVTAVYLSPVLFILTIIFAIVSFFIFKKRLAYVRNAEKEISIHTVAVGEEISSALSDLKFMRQTASEDDWLRRITASATDLSANRRRQLTIPPLTRSLVDIPGALLLVTVLAISVTILDDSALGLVFVAIFYRMIPRLQVAQTQIGIAVGQSVWVTRWNTNMTLLGKPKPRLETTHRSNDGVMHRTGFDVKFESVEVSYETSTSPVLDKLTFSLLPGQKLAVVGPSGVGKTTMLDTLTGLLVPQSGDVLVDGHSTRSFNHEQMEWFRRDLAVVSQDVSIRRGSIRSNIVWDRPVNESWLEQVVKLAGLEDVLSRMPDGLDSYLSSKSLGISGGQRQRIGLARALYRQPRLLLLDEATSALDSTTESQLLRNIATLAFAPTIVFITHRGTVLDICDLVLTLDGARSPTVSFVAAPPLVTKGDGQHV